MPTRRKITLLALLLAALFASWRPALASATTSANRAQISETASADFSEPPHLASAIFACNPRQALGKTLNATTKCVYAFSYGKEADQLSRLNYYGYRYYDPLSLTWTQADPLYRLAPDIAGANPRKAALYTFSLNNPIRYFDPDGRDQYDRSKPIGDDDLAVIGAKERKEREEKQAKNPTNLTDGGNPISSTSSPEVSDSTLLWGAVALATTPFVAASLMAAAIFVEKGPAGGSEMALVVVGGSLASGTGRVVAKGGGGAAKSAATPIGRRGNPMNVPRGTNSPSTIGGRQYSGHALDQMQGRGIMPSVVDDAIAGGGSAGKVPGTTAHFSKANKITVLTDTTSGRVITVGHGRIRQ